MSGETCKILDDEMLCTVRAEFVPGYGYDVGKLGIPDSTLLKPGPLDEQERAIMNTHTTIGAKILAGSGYPEGLSGEAFDPRVVGVFLEARPQIQAIPAEYAEATSA